MNDGNSNDSRHRDAPVNSRMQPDPQLQEGPAGAGRIAVYAVAIAVLLGAVLFGLHNAPTSVATVPPPATTANSAPAALRDVPPNRQPETTTGAAPAQPIQPPQSNPTGTLVDRSKGGGT